MGREHNFNSFVVSYCPKLLLTVPCLRLLQKVSTIEARDRVLKYA
jgi:hypothetical protein